MPILFKKFFISSLNSLDSDNIVVNLSPRELIFPTKPSPIKIIAVDESMEKITFDFVEKKTKALPLYYWMFDFT